MSGVNAHMLMATPPNDAMLRLSPLSSMKLPWQRTRFWPSPFLARLSLPVGYATLGIFRCDRTRNAAVNVSVSDSWAEQILLYI